MISNFTILSFSANAFLVGGIVFFISGLVGMFFVKKLNTRLNRIFQGKSVKDLEDVIVSQNVSLQEIHKTLEKISQEITMLKERSERSIQKIGVVRFNPFDDKGGDQSFAVALLDLQDNGFVMSAIHAREGVRTYTKPIEGGICSKYILSKEEEEAIERARLSITQHKT